MTRPLDGALLKVNRAEEHLRTLDEHVVAFLEQEPKPYTLSRQTGTNGRRRQERVYIEVVKQPPPWIGVLVGDVIHNLRSALDYVAYELDRSLPSRYRSSGKTQFPVVVENAAKYRTSGLPFVSSLPGPHRAMIRKIQPYQGRDEQERREHPLAILNALSNRDKHRVVPTTVAQVNEHTARVYGTGLQAIYDIRHTVGPVEREAELLFVDYEVTDAPEPEVHIEGNISLDVALPQGLPVREVMLNLINEVRAIAGWFDPALP